MYLVKQAVTVGPIGSCVYVQRTDKSFDLEWTLPMPPISEHLVRPFIEKEEQ